MPSRSSNQDSTHNEAAYLEAGKWVSRHDRGLSEQEELEFLDWLSEDVIHGEYYEECKENWKQFDKLATVEVTETREPTPYFLNKRRTQFIRWGWAAAALLLLSFGVLVFNGIYSFADYRMLADGSVAGTYERHVLEDESVVELNEGAQVSVLYTQTSRSLKLLSGQAHFSVSPDAERPFVVQAGSMEIKAIGTAFSITLQEMNIEVMVTEGKVALFANTSEETESSEAISIAPPVELVAGQIAVHTTQEFQSFSPAVTRPSSEEIQTKLTWKDEILDFNSVSLLDVVKAFNSRNYTQIIIEDSALNDVSITAALKPKNIDGFIRLLELIADVEYEVNAEGDILLKKR